MPLICLAVLLLFAAPAVATDLGSGAERFARAPVILDARLARRTCPPEGFLFAWAGQAVEARCHATGERILLPLAAEPEPARVRRGESVQADYVGSGFRISVGAITETSGRNGQLTLRNSRSGQRFGARVDQSGRIIVSNSED